MAAFDPATRLQRLEQQLEAFERLHGDELREFQRRLEAYQRLQEDEVRLLREEIAALRAALPAASGADTPSPQVGDVPAAPSAPDSPAPATPGPPKSGGTGQVPPAGPADPAAVEPVVEGAVESALDQTISRRELFGGQRASSD
jgi:hypothetical protein